MHRKNRGTVQALSHVGGLGAMCRWQRARQRESSTEHIGVRSMMLVFGDTCAI